MSDAGRKSFTTKAEEAITPDSQKSTYDKAKEYVTDTADSVAAKVQPEENKGVAQTAGDVAHDAKGDINDANKKVSDDASKAGESYYDQAAKVVNEYKESGSQYLAAGEEKAKEAIQAAGEYINSASEYVQGKEEPKK